MGAWEEGHGQPSCVLSGNYCDERGEASFEEGRLRDYIREYLVPVTRGILDGLRTEGSVDYNAVAMRVLERIGKEP